MSLDGLDEIDDHGELDNFNDLGDVHDSNTLNWVLRMYYIQ